MAQSRSKNQRKALIATVVFHSIMLLLFIIFGLKTPTPLPEEQGLAMDLNFGVTDAGSGDVQPENSGDVEPEPTPEPVEEPAAAPQPVEQATITSPEESAVSVPKEKPKKEQPKEEPKPEKKLDDKLNSTLTNAFKNRKEKSGGSEGDTDQKGDQGKKEGTKTGRSYVGQSGGGNGGSGTTGYLKGRKMLAAPAINDNSQDVGTVVVDIIVDRKGNVISASPGARGTTTTSSNLLKLAKEAALKATFTPKTDAAPEQKGVMTFVFEVR